LVHLIICIGKVSGWLPQVVTGYMSNPFALGNTKTKLETLNGSCFTLKHHA